MTSPARTRLVSPRDGAVPTTPSELPCDVCGQHALEQHAPQEPATGLIGRKTCAVCGAHHLSTL